MFCQAFQRCLVIKTRQSNQKRDPIVSRKIHWNPFGTARVLTVGSNKLRVYRLANDHHHECPFLKHSSRWNWWTVVEVTDCGPYTYDKSFAQNAFLWDFFIERYLLSKMCVFVCLQSSMFASSSLTFAHFNLLLNFLINLLLLFLRFSVCFVWQGVSMPWAMMLSQSLRHCLGDFELFSLFLGISKFNVCSTQKCNESFNSLLFCCN